MNRGLLWRAFRESWPTTLGLALALAAVEAALAFVMAKFGAQMSQDWVKMEFQRRIMQAMLGTELGQSIGPLMLQSVAWVEPVVLALAGAHAIISCTRVPAGEVDRGTVDVLLSLPVSRWEVFLSESFICLVGGATVLAAAFGGNLLGSLELPVEQRAQVPRVLLVLFNMFCLYFCVGGFVWLLSSLSNRRGRAVTVAVLALLGIFLLSYSAQFWEPLQRIVFLSPLQYHQPFKVLSSGITPWKDIAILLSLGAGFWTAAGLIFARRDLCTV